MSLGVGAALAALALPAGAPTLSLAANDGADAAPPQRVVSINVCTDQLAMLIARPGQLLSVSSLATDPQTSLMTAEASAHTLNHGAAEEIFLMKPDLVLAGTYTRRPTVALLQRLGFPVEQFAPATSFDDIRANIRRMGALLGRQARAEALVSDLNARLEATRTATQGKKNRRRAGLTFANSYTSGAGTLSQAALNAAGLENIAKDFGVRGMARLPLEALVMADPDLVVSSTKDYGAPALAGETIRHPAYRALAREKTSVDVPTKYWVCGGPFTVEAVRILREAADSPAADNFAATARWKP